MLFENIVCVVCSKKFNKSCPPSMKPANCSRECAIKSRTKHLAGNKFREGKIPTNAWKKGDNTGEQHHLWKGDKAGYSAIHDWVSLHFGIPRLCDNCGFISEKSMQFNWANISHEYKRERDDWVRLCKMCHYQFDQDSWGVATQKFPEIRYKATEARKARNREYMREYRKRVS